MVFVAKSAECDSTPPTFVDRDSERGLRRDWH
ncbi:unnamed protein product [Ectocarpus sp. CCAP 1310/34]|nr:unnamed protein product [Ectocarpus sp. CCAP 1310/34]